LPHLLAARVLRPPFSFLWFDSRRPTEFRATLPASLFCRTQYITPRHDFQLLFSAVDRCRTEFGVPFPSGSILFLIFVNILNSFMAGIPSSGGQVVLFYFRCFSSFPRRFPPHTGLEFGPWFIRAGFAGVSRRPGYAALFPLTDPPRCLYDKCCPDEYLMPVTLFDLRRILPFLPMSSRCLIPLTSLRSNRLARVSSFLFLRWCAALLKNCGLYFSLRISCWMVAYCYR